MASEAMGDELVSCTICFERFTNPKTLQCLHTFCETCLRRHLAAFLSQRQDLIRAIPCPTCREFTPLPDQGISGLRTDFKISKITELLHQVSSKDKSCDVCRTVQRESNALFYCRECNKHFCTECIYRHKNTELFDGHVVKELSTNSNSKWVCSEHKDEMETLRYFCQSCEIPVCTLCAMTDHMLHNLTDIDTGKARHNRTKKIRGLLLKVDNKITQLEQFLRKLDSFEENLKSSYLSTTDMISKRADHLVSQIRLEEQELMTCLQTQYEGKLENVCSERQSLMEHKDGLTALKKSSDLALELKEDEQQPFFETSSELIRDLKAAAQVTFLNPDDFQEVKAGFELTFPKETPKLGTLGEANISSNLHLMSRVPIQLVTKITNGNLDWPSDAAIMSDQKIIVADTENFQLKVFDSSGNFKQAIGMGEIKPAGVVVTKVRTIAVTDILERCVKIFSEHGQMLFEFGHDLFDSPAGITVNSYGQYIVTDIGHHCVTIHDSQGHILARLGGYGNSDLTFDCPWYVATNDQNDIIVADMGNNAIKIFDYQLHLVCKIQDADILTSPSGIDVDIQGNLIVCDSSRNTVSMFTPDGHLIDHILTEQDGIINPQGASVTESGRLVITQCGENKAVAKHQVRLYQLYE